MAAIVARAVLHRHHQTFRFTEQGEHHPGAVVLAVNIQDRQDQQIGEYERDDTAEADATVPKNCGQWHIADRADEGHDRDYGPDDRSP